MDVIEKPGEFSTRFARWRGGEDLAGYPFVHNTFAPFTPLRRALPMLNLALISSAGAYIDGTEPFDIDKREGDTDIREFPLEVAAEDFRYAAKGYDPRAVGEDRNCLIPIERLLEYEANVVIGKLNDVWWSVSSYIPDAVAVADVMAPRLAERLHRYEVQAALLIPASRLCHQTMSLLARGIEMTGIPTIVISAGRKLTEDVRPPRSVYYDAKLGSLVGDPHWPEYQLRVLDETLR
jgi:D-proline reductase (dithiol) PrdB